MNDNFEICDYLNITTTTNSDSNNLTAKFAHLEASQNVTLFEWLFSSMTHQFVVAKCAYQFKVAQVASDFYRDNVLIFYEKYPIISPVTTWIVLPNIFTPISIIFNLSLILVTITTMKDRKVCNWLIAFDSLCQLFVVAPFGVNLVGVIFRHSAIDYRICLATLMSATVASYASIMAMFLISVERLLIVLCPIRMNSIKKSTVCQCSLLSVILCTLFGLVMNLEVFNIWTIINIPYDRWVYCNSGLYSDVLNSVPSFVILSLCCANYAAIFGLILWRNFQMKRKNQMNSQTADQSVRKMLRSVFLLLLVLLIGWLITSAARNKITSFIKFITPLIVNLFVAEPMAQSIICTNIQSVLIGMITCVPILASASGAPILLLNSIDYRIAYKKAFMRRKNNSAAVGPHFHRCQIVAVSNERN